MVVVNISRCFCLFFMLKPIAIFCTQNHLSLLEQAPTTYISLVIDMNIVIFDIL